MLAAGSTARNLFPPLFDRCFVASQVQGTTQYPLLQEFQQRISTLVFPLHATLHLGSLSMYYVWEVRHADHSTFWD